MDSDVAEDVLVSDRIPQDAVGIVDKTLETVREWAGALVGDRRRRWQRPQQRRLIRHQNVRVDVDLRNIMLAAGRNGWDGRGTGVGGDGVEFYRLDPGAGVFGGVLGVPGGSGVPGGFVPG
jgi:hypothetical protein